MTVSTLVSSGGGATGPAPWDFNLSAPAYVALTTYAQRDAVTYDGSFWVSLIDSNTGNTPGDDPTKWHNVAQGISANLAADVAAAQAVAAGYADTILVSDYIPSAQMTLIRNNDVAGQDAALVGAGLQAAHDAGKDIALARIAAGDPWRVVFRYPRKMMATDRELFSETFAQFLWDVSHDNGGQSGFVFDGGGAVFKCAGWTTHKAVRTSGFYAQNSITDPVHKALFRWELPAKYDLGPICRGMNFLGEKALTDPIGVKLRNCNGQRWINCSITGFRAQGFFAESVNNSDFPGLELRSCGLQPTLASTSTGVTTSTVRITTNTSTSAVPEGVTTATATEDVFTSDDVGKWLGIAGASTGGNAHFSKISTFTDARNVILTDPVVSDVTDKAFTFTMMTGSVIGGGTALVLDQDVTGIDMVGRYVGVYKAGSEIHGDQDILVTRVTAQSGANLTLASNARWDADNVPVIVSPDFFMGFSDDHVTALGVNQGGNNNDIDLSGLWVEHSSDADFGGSVCAIIQTAYEVQLNAAKFHGQDLNTQNFGGNAACIFADNVKQLQASDAMLVWGQWEPDYGTVVTSGARTCLQFSQLGFGLDVTSNRTTEFFLDPRSGATANTNRLVFDGQHNTSTSRWFGGNQYIYRLGANATEDMVAASGPLVHRDSSGFVGMPAIRGPVVDLTGGNEPGYKWNGNDLFAAKTTFTPDLYFGADNFTDNSGVIAANDSYYYARGGLWLVHVDITLSNLGTGTGTAFLYLPDAIAPIETGWGLSSLLVTGTTGVTASITATAGSPLRRFSLLYPGSGGTGISNMTNANFTNTTRLMLNGFWPMDLS